MKRIFIATLVGAAIAFLWGYVSWELMSWHRTDSFKDNNEVARAIRDNAPLHGVYMLPTRGEQGLDAEALTNGPVIYATVRPGKLDDPWTLSSRLIRSFLIQFSGALVIALTVHRIRARRFLSRASIGPTMGLFAGLVMTLPSWNWLELPGNHALARGLDPLICWTLAGIVIAAIVKPPPTRKIFSR